MRPALEELDTEEAVQVVGNIIRRKKAVNMPELEESFRRSVSTCGKSSKEVCKVISKAIKNLKKKGKVRDYYSKLQYQSQKS